MPSDLGVPGAGADSQRLHREMTRLAKLHPEGLCKVVVDLVAEEIGLEIVFVTRFDEFSNGKPTHARIVAAAGRPKTLIGHLYELKHTPCEDVEDFCQACVPENVCERYPQDDDLVELGVTSYAGVAMTGLDGTSLGAVISLSKHPIADQQMVMRRLGVIAQRLAIEVERRRHARSVKASERRYRSLVDAMPDALVVHQDGKIVYANPMAATMRGVESAEQLVGRDSEINGQPDANGVKAYSGVRSLDRAGEERVVECTATLIEHNGAPAVQVIERDLTYERRTERRLFRIFEISPEPVALICPNGYPQMVNQEMRRVFGVADPPPRSHFHDWLVEPHRSEVEALLKEARESADVVAKEYPFPGEGGSLRSMYISAYADPEDGSVAFGCKDTTEQREEAQRLRHAERAHSVAVLSGGLAHDLGNLISAISGQLYVAESKLSHDTDMAGVLTNVREVVTHAAELKDSLITLGGGCSVAHRPVDLEKLAASLKPVLVGLAGDSIHLSIWCECELGACVVSGDEARLKQVLFNLTDNAVQVLGERDDAFIRVELRHMPGVEGTRGRVEVSVADNGPGVDESIRDTIFDPFFTTRVRTKGTGLGLALCRAIVEAHDGTIRVESGEGETGARFVVSLPCFSDACEEGDQEIEHDSLTGRHIKMCLSPGQERDIIGGMLGHLGAVITEEAEAEACIAPSQCQSLECAAGVRVVLLHQDEALTADNAVALHRPFGYQELESAVREALSLSRRTR